MASACYTYAKAIILMSDELLNGKYKIIDDFCRYKRAGI